MTNNVQTTINRATPAEIPVGLWNKCKSCEEVIYTSSLENNHFVCPSCKYHYPLTAWQRIELLTDEDGFTEIDPALHSYDVLSFGGDQSYALKLTSAEEKTGLREGVVTGKAVLQGCEYFLAVMDFRFMGASMGSAIGEKITRMLEISCQERRPAVIVTASGGARMQEGILSLMQMGKTSGAAMRMDEAGLPLIIILTDPTTGGVTASFASLGDIILAEPKALIGFAGPRVIKQTTKTDLPEGFQSSEFLLKHGFIDRIVERKDLRHELALLFKYLGFGHGV